MTDEPHFKILNEDLMTDEEKEALNSVPITEFQKWTSEQKVPAKMQEYIFDARTILLSVFSLLKDVESNTDMPKEPLGILIAHLNMAEHALGVSYNILRKDIKDKS